MPASPPPNILVCTWHDTGRHFGCYGQPTVETPSVDRLAAEGVLLTRAFCASAKCTPSRGALLTGHWPQSNGLYYLCHGNFGHRLHAGARTLAQILGEHGYYTVLHGFQHEEHAEDAGRLGHHERHNHRRPPPTWQVPPCDVIARDAAAWLEARPPAGSSPEARPFFMQLGFFETHRPYAWGGVEPDRARGVALPPWIEPTPELEADVAALQGSIRKADAAFGVVLEGLRRGGHERDTIVVFTVDHGLDFEGAKGTCYEPGLEIALVVRWPGGGVAGGRRVDDLVSNVDVLPTLLALAGLPAEPGLPGVPFAGLLQGGPHPQPRCLVPAMIEEGERRSIRDDRWKLIRNFTQLRTSVRPVRRAPGRDAYMSSGGPPCYVERAVGRVELYDLRDDPLETRNLADDPAAGEVRVRLDAALWSWMESVNDPLLALPHLPRWRDNLRDYLQWRAGD